MVSRKLIGALALAGVSTAFAQNAPAPAPNAETAPHVLRVRMVRAVFCNAASKPIRLDTVLQTMYPRPSDPAVVPPQAQELDALVAATATFMSLAVVPQFLPVMRALHANGQLEAQLQDTNSPLLQSLAAYVTPHLQSLANRHSTLAYLSINLRPPQLDETERAAAKCNNSRQQAARLAFPQG